jgi:hypothetical protein
LVRLPETNIKQEFEITRQTTIFVLGRKPRDLFSGLEVSFEFELPRSFTLFFRKLYRVGTSEQNSSVTGIHSTGVGPVPYCTKKAMLHLFITVHQVFLMKYF